LKSARGLAPRPVVSRCILRPKSSPRKVCLCTTSLYVLHSQHHPHSLLGFCGGTQSRNFVRPHHDHSAIYIRRTSRSSLLIPALVIADFGTHQPVIQETKNGLSQSCVMFSSAMFTGAVDPYPDTLHFPGHGWIDVRDASTAHVRAHPRVRRVVRVAGLQCVSNCLISFCLHTYSSLGTVDAANALSPRSPNWKPLAKGTPGQAHRAITFVTTKQKEILGIEYRTKEQTTRDILDDWAAHGW
jgi:hypothetical protein